VTLSVNGKKHNLRIDPRTTLLDCLRDHLLLTGTKKGCDHGHCGACTVHINGRRMNSCLVLAGMHECDEITTIEGLGQPENLHPIQAAFLSYEGYHSPRPFLPRFTLESEGATATAADRENRLLVENWANVTPLSPVLKHVAMRQPNVKDEGIMRIERHVRDATAHHAGPMDRGL
jgi:xanthine dehydrogenase iron-sulfur cluster and FAD-binding subunit A